METFENNGHKIILGDVIEALSQQVEDNSIDLIFADPPYNIGKTSTGEWINGLVMLTI